MSQYFSLFGLPPQFDTDTAELEKRYRALAAQCHPDKTATRSAFEQKQAVMMAAAVNEAYRILKNPIDRAAYLLREVHRTDADAPEHTSFATEFLMQQMQWREELDDARGNEAALNALNRELAAAHHALTDELAAAFAAGDSEAAAELVRRGRFLNKLQQEIQTAMP
ncbi:Fe-S protein assembly co-chaperone HscB [Neisseria leonii]|uniref:Co-chaperone protein HscB homolog n=1 Tax=Neisseria leonii TaxID=2995413 RepID=A0A9X4E0F3_9NEIS|nr:Fe-S protein assembly co-chaperone HscB [Neisseria sp. 51.81]MDD9327172.1 Fe-S protein assembly co-chaperone HscB [Neisseria sp. 51.81]